jgi:hypothetical protein
MTYGFADPAVMENGQQGEWKFNLEFEINAIGTSQTNHLNGNDLIAFLPGVKESICRRADENLGISPIPVINNAAYSTAANITKDSGYALPSTELIIGDANLPEFSGQPYGCFHETAADTYIYFFALYER